jgi:hypothetical protein
MDLNHFAKFFKQEQFSDVDVVIRLINEPPRDGGEAPPAKRTRRGPQPTASASTELGRFPAHRVVLAGTDYFQAQVSEGRANNL